MYECFHCGNKTVIWDCDYDYEDYGFDGDGIVHVCHCSACGADIEYYIDCEEEIEEEIEEEMFEQISIYDLPNV